MKIFVLNLMFTNFTRHGLDVNTSKSLYQRKKIIVFFFPTKVNTYGYFKKANSRNYNVEAKFHEILS